MCFVLLIFTALKIQSNHLSFIDPSRLGQTKPCLVSSLIVIRTAIAPLMLPYSVSMVNWIMYEKSKQIFSPLEPEVPFINLHGSKGKVTHFWHHSLWQMPMNIYRQFIDSSWKVVAVNLHDLKSLLSYMQMNDIALPVIKQYQLMFLNFSGV